MPWGTLTQTLRVKSDVWEHGCGGNDVFRALDASGSIAPFLRGADEARREEVTPRLEARREEEDEKRRRGSAVSGRVEEEGEQDVWREEWREGGGVKEELRNSSTGPEGLHLLRLITQGAKKCPENTKGVVMIRSRVWRQWKLFEENFSASLTEEEIYGGNTTVSLSGMLNKTGPDKISSVFIAKGKLFCPEAKNHTKEHHIQ